MYIVYLIGCTPLFDIANEQSNIINDHSEIIFSLGNLQKPERTRSLFRFVIHQESYAFALGLVSNTEKLSSA